MDGWRMNVALTSTMLRSDLRAKLGRRGCVLTVLWAAAVVVMLLLAHVALHQHHYTFRNPFSLHLRSASQHTYLLPTGPRAGNQVLYQQDAIQELNSMWTEESRAAWVAVLQERRDRLREACRRTNHTGRLSFQSDLLPRRSLVWAAPLGVVWCPIFKAGSTTWTKNLLLASNNASGKANLHAELRELYPPPASATEQERMLNISMRLIVVRHPFERLLSAYRDKMLRVRNPQDPCIKQQQEIAHSYMDTEAQPLPYSPEELQKATDDRHNATGLVHPTFTQFLKKVRDDVRKKGGKKNRQVNNHWRPFWIACEPCHLDYDVIAHVETLAEDQEFVIRELGLQDRLRPARTHASKFDGYNDTSTASEAYFRKVPLKLMESLAELLRPDFDMFGYSPHKYIAMAAPPRDNTIS
ncbi:carbohydrate sulfotransferase 13-like isoform X1 [Eriocheir sinensis]|uniref:carbohydrate sulfotransferase 13-like isoform X1 n=1 Tax=Eriocheir sinensis TaxID=95602 RepID=UPI0021C96E05|nr:carbohydrate sulfotransferase 13-like isoform X1 [Eriocheir sinensis]